MTATRYVWDWVGFDSRLPIHRLEIVLDTPDPKVAALVEQAARSHEIKLLLRETADERAVAQKVGPTQ